MYIAKGTICRVVSDSRGKMSFNAFKVISILFVLMFVFLPMGFILISNEPPGPYYPTQVSQVEAALKATGLDLCEKSDATWKVTGAMGGFTTLVSADCSARDQSNAIYIHTQQFDTVQNRDSAVSLIKKSINMNDINGAVYTYGSYVIAVQGPTGGKPITDTVEKVKAQLQK